MEEKFTRRQLIDNAKSHARGFSSDPKEQVRHLQFLSSSGLITPKQDKYLRQAALEIEHENKACFA